MVIVASGRAAMRFYYFEIVIEKEPEDEGYSAYSPSLPGCFSNGRTIEEARRNMREAIQQHVASLLAQREPVPQNERGATPEEVEATVAAGERFPARFGRTGYRRNFAFAADWRGRRCQTKQVEAYAVEEDGDWLVITVLVKYF